MKSVFLALASLLLIPGNCSLSASASDNAAAPAVASPPAPVKTTKVRPKPTTVAPATATPNPAPATPTAVLTSTGLEINPQGCAAFAGAIAGQCLPCQDFCEHPFGSVAGGTPDEAVVDSAFGRGTKCYCVPAGIPPSLVGAAQIYNFIEDWTGNTTDSVQQLQPGQFPYSSGLTHEVHLKLWWRSTTHANGTAGPRHNLTDTPVTLSINYYTATPERITKTVNLLTEGTKLCGATIVAPNPVDPSYTIESWLVTLPEDAALIWFSGLVPLLPGECITMDADITVHSFKP